MHHAFFVHFFAVAARLRLEMRTGSLFGERVKKIEKTERKTENREPVHRLPFSRYARSLVIANATCNTGCLPITKIYPENPMGW